MTYFVKGKILANNSYSKAADLFTRSKYLEEIESKDARLNYIGITPVDYIYKGTKIYLKAK